MKLKMHNKDSEMVEVWDNSEKCLWGVIHEDFLTNEGIDDFYLRHGEVKQYEITLVGNKHKQGIKR